MKTVTLLIELQNDLDENSAVSVGMSAAEHLLETFNDDNSILAVQVRNERDEVEARLIP